jgi:hypothetical protein
MSRLMKFCHLFILPVWPKVEFRDLNNGTEYDESDQDNPSYNLCLYSEHVKIYIVLKLHSPMGQPCLSLTALAPWPFVVQKPSSKPALMEIH